MLCYRHPLQIRRDLCLRRSKLNRMMATRKTLRQAAYKLMTARSSPSILDGPSYQTQGADKAFGESAALSELADNKLVFCGEIHSRPPIVAFQQALQQEMAQSAQKLHVVMEHFSLDMDGLLQQYQKGEIDFEQLKQQYNDHGSEGHDLDPYKPLLEDAREHNHKIKLHGGFIPRQFARVLIKDGIDAVREQTSPEWLPIQINLDGTDFHYNVFESLITGRPFFESTPPTDGFRKIFKAQVLKDVSMANKVNQLLAGEVADQQRRDGGSGEHVHTHAQGKENVVPTTLASALTMSTAAGSSKADEGAASSAGVKQEPKLEIGDGKYVASVKVEDDRARDTRNGMTDQTEPRGDKYLVIAGNGHLMNYCGVPERVLEAHPTMAGETSLVLSMSSTVDLDDDEACKDDIQSMYGPEGSNPADYIYLYQDEEEMAKEETKAAYDKVGESAHLEGNMRKAQAIMSALGYTEEQFQIAGADAYNYQGVGNPHIHANIQPGDVVLDIGSGLGIDSFIAAAATGPAGKVLGIDLSSKQVEHARSRAHDRRQANLQFEVADMERLPIPDNSFDVIISNGAFCLAPNKERAFAEVFRILKPGGRISICTSTIQDESLEPGVNWPSCMKLFVAKTTIQPMCEALGFVEVQIDGSDSSMSMELPAEALEGSNPDRNKVHVGGDEFKHLESYDMDKLCARVVVVARKPLEEGHQPHDDISDAKQ